MGRRKNRGQEERGGGGGPAAPPQQGHATKGEERRPQQRRLRRGGGGPVDHPARGIVFGAGVGAEEVSAPGEHRETIYRLEQYSPVGVPGPPGGAGLQRRVHPAVPREAVNRTGRGETRRFRSEEHCVSRGGCTKRRDAKSCYQTRKYGLCCRPST